MKIIKNEDLAFIYATDERNFPFLLPFVFFANKYNPGAKFGFHIFGKKYLNDKKLIDGINFLKHYCKIDVLKLNIIEKSIHKPQHYRFIANQLIDTSYVYIGDIDIMICESILKFHIDKMHDQYVYDNECRGYCNSSRMSGLHFCNKQWFQMTQNIRHMFLKNGTAHLNDEELLNKIARLSNIKLRPSEKTTQTFNALRPIHGQHISLSRAPFKKNSTMANVLNLKFKDAFISTVTDYKFKLLVCEFCPSETFSIFNEYMKFVNLAW